MSNAGRMTATARGDIGARIEARPQAWVWGCVQMCDDVRPQRTTISIGSLRCFAPRASSRHIWRTRWRERESVDVISCQFCILMPPGSTWAPATCSFAVPAERDAEPVRRFSTFTCDLNALADWLTLCGIRSVAMESTSVYWIPVYQILESPRIRSMPGKRAARKECARPEDRRIRLSVDSILAFGRPSARQLSPAGNDLRDSLYMAAPRQPHRKSRRTRSAHAKGTLIR